LVWFGLVWFGLVWFGFAAFRGLIVEDLLRLSANAIPIKRNRSLTWLTNRWFVGIVHGLDGTAALRAIAVLDPCPIRRDLRSFDDTGYLARATKWSLR
jgi:hypothetical protein